MSAGGIEVTKVMMNNTPVTSDVLLVESIGTPFGPVVGWLDGGRCGVSFLDRRVIAARWCPVGWSGSTWVTDSSGRPRSRTLASRPCSAAWSTTGPWRTVVPSPSWLRVIPSNRAAQRELRRP